MNFVIVMFIKNQFFIPVGITEKEIIRIT